jgi:hypothetical protein
MSAREDASAAQKRWERLALLQEHYSDFTPFLEDVMAELGFSTTPVQKAIGRWMSAGPQYLMVQAQRSQAKTTIAAAFSVWSLIHDPTCRVLILSAGGTQANEISTLVVRIILTMDVLACMRPDKTAGDRTSTEAFDVHHSLKGLDKSPSVACVGIDSNLQGKRADLLIADDIESSKNSATPGQRAKLLHLTKDFTSICTSGRIIWLGTPQTMESIYNSLPQRGVSIRIWPGRYPTAQQMAHYGQHLDPAMRRAIELNSALATGGGLLGDQGQPTDPVLLGEEALQKKERDQGAAYFQLQHMLNTALSDAQRFPLKPHNLVIMRGASDRFPMTVVRGMEDTHMRDFSVGDFAFKMASPHEVSRETSPLQSKVFYLDPAGGGKNGDETAFAFGGFLNSNIHLLLAGGVAGGYSESGMRELAQIVAKCKPDILKIEKNMGFGAFRAVFLPILREYLQCQVEDDLVTGQKELRIIETLDPVIGRGSLIVHESAVESDAFYCERYGPTERIHFSLFHQMAKISRIRDALVHDDRLDALEGLVRHYQEQLAQDQKKKLEALQKAEFSKAIADPLGYKQYTKAPSSAPNMLNRFRRR